MGKRAHFVGKEEFCNGSTVDGSKIFGADQHGSPIKNPYRGRGIFFCLITSSVSFILTYSISDEGVGGEKSSIHRIDPSLLFPINNSGEIPVYIGGERANLPSPAFFRAGKRRMEAKLFRAKRRKWQWKKVPGGGSFFFGKELVGWLFCATKAGERFAIFQLLPFFLEPLLHVGKTTINSRNNLGNIIPLVLPPSHYITAVEEGEERGKIH